MAFDKSHDCRPDGTPHWQVADRAAAMLVADDIDGAEALFDWGDVPAPTIVWNPSPRTLPHPTMIKFYEAWAAMPRHGGQNLPLASDFDILTFEDAMGFMMYLDVLDGGADFRYRVYGSRVAHYSGFDLTGKRLSQAQIPSITREFMAACYMAVTARRDPMFTFHSSPRHFLKVAWNRIAVPLVDADGAVIRVIGANIPTGDRQPEDDVRSVFH